MGSASLAAARPTARPPARPAARTVTTIPLQPGGLRGKKQILSMEPAQMKCWKIWWPQNLQSRGHISRVTVISQQRESLKRESCCDGNFIIIEGTKGCHYDNLWCHQWWQSYASCFSFQQFHSISSLPHTKMDAEFLPNPATPPSIKYIGVDS